MGIVSVQDEQLLVLCQQRHEGEKAKGQKQPHLIIYIN